VSLLLRRKLHPKGERKGKKEMKEREDKLKTKINISIQNINEVHKRA
jgi:hypothetical protein